MGAYEELLLRNEPTLYSTHSIASYSELESTRDREGQTILGENIMWGVFDDQQREMECIKAAAKCAN